MLVFWGCIHLQELLAPKTNGCNLGWKGTSSELNHLHYWGIPAVSFRASVQQKKVHPPKIRKHVPWKGITFQKDSERIVFQPWSFRCKLPVFGGVAFQLGSLYDTNPNNAPKNGNSIEFTKMGNLKIPVQTPFFGVPSALGRGGGKANSVDLHHPFRLRKKGELIWAACWIHLTMHHLLYLHLQLSVCHASKIQTSHLKENNHNFGTYHFSRFCLTFQLCLQLCFFATSSAEALSEPCNFLTFQMILRRFPGAMTAT